MRLNEPPATMVALEEIIAVRGCVTESQLDALEWAKEFMNNYEKRKKNVVHPTNAIESCGTDPELRDIPSPGEESMGNPETEIDRKDPGTPD